MRHASSLATVVCAAVIAVGCGGATPDTGNQGQPLPAPVSSLSPAVAGTVALVSQALLGAGFQLFPPTAPYRPSEPSSLTQTPRVVLQTSGPDTDQGYVIVYSFPTSADATTAGNELARYLASGFGQTNFPFDAQFSVAQVGSTIVFTWYSGARASDATSAQSAFEAIRSVGQAFPVVK
jgi:hypothetical protein